MPLVPSYNDAKKMIVDQHNNSTIQSLMRQYLRNLNLSTIMGKEDCDVTAELEEMLDTINK